MDNQMRSNVRYIDAAREAKQRPTHQLENGYTQICNEVIQDLVWSRLSANEIKIVLFVIMKSWGYRNRKYAAINARYISDGCDIEYSKACKTIKKLIEGNILIKETDNQGNTLFRYQKYPSEWTYGNNRNNPRNIPEIRDGIEPYFDTESVVINDNNEAPSSGTNRTTLNEEKVVEGVVRFVPPQMVRTVPTKVVRTVPTINKQYLKKGSAASGTCHLPQKNAASNPPQNDIDEKLENIPADNPENVTLEPPPKREQIPFQKIVDLYHKILPMMPVVKKLTDSRRGYIRQRWQTGDIQGLDEWEQYFKMVATSKFLTGQCEAQAGKRPFMANLEWITRPNNFVNIWEWKYHR